VKLLKELNQKTENIEDFIKDMSHNISKILALDPGTKYLGVAAFEGEYLLDWKIKSFRGKYDREKQKKILQAINHLVDEYSADILVLKKKRYYSDNLNALIQEIQHCSRYKGLKLYRYSLKETEDFFISDGKKNTSNLATIMVAKYPELGFIFNKEQSNQREYYSRMFKTVALGVMCFYELEKINPGFFNNTFPAK